MKKLMFIIMSAGLLISNGAWAACDKKEFGKCSAQCYREHRTAREACEDKECSVADYAKTLSDYQTCVATCKKKTGCDESKVEEAKTPAIKKEPLKIIS